MRVLLTGATGFLGSHVLRRLLADRDEVAVLIRPESDRWRVEDVIGSATVIAGGLEALAKTRPALEAFRPEAVIHLAWQGVAGGYDDAVHIDRNLPATVALAALARDVGCRAFVGVGTQMEYGPRDGRINEETVPRPANLYGAAKLGAGLASRVVCAQAGVRLVWLRLFSAYGPMDDPRWLIPSIIVSLLRGEKPALTKGEQLWDYLYADDAADAVVLAARAPRMEGFFNLGSGKGVAIRRVAERVRDAVDPKLPLGLGERPYGRGQVMRLEADIGRIQAAAAWSPRTGFEDGVIKTVQWYRDHGARFLR